MLSLNNKISKRVFTRYHKVCVTVLKRSRFGAARRAVNSKGFRSLRAL